jgi:hypothetical protein
MDGLRGEAWTRDLSNVKLESYQLDHDVLHNDAYSSDDKWDSCVWIGFRQTSCPLSWETTALSSRHIQRSSG